MQFENQMKLLNIEPCFQIFYLPLPWNTTCFRIWVIANGSCIGYNRRDNVATPIWIFPDLKRNLVKLLQVITWSQRFHEFFLTYHLGRFGLRPHHNGYSCTTSYRGVPKGPDKPSKNRICRLGFYKSCDCSLHPFL